MKARSALFVVALGAVAVVTAARCNLLVGFEDCASDAQCRAGERCNPARRYCEVPTVELCNGEDDDRDGVPDGSEDFGLCEVPRGTPGCRDGARRCRSNNALACVQRTAFRPMETCNDGIDDDCNGVVDDGAPCMQNFPETVGLLVGSNDPTYGEGDDAPAHRVCVGAFALDRYEVTFRAYATYLNTLDPLRLRFGAPPAPINTTEPYGRYVMYEDDGGTVVPLLLVPAPADDLTIDRVGDRFAPHAPGAASLPVVNVTWFGADRYCRWAGKHLPSEAEWWRAVKGGDVQNPRAFPWGNEMPTCDRANVGVGGPDSGACVGRPVPVGSLAAGREPQGVFELYGNVSEWMWDYLDDNLDHSRNNYYHLFDRDGDAGTSTDRAVNPWCRAFPQGPLGPDAGAPIARAGAGTSRYCERCRFARGRHFQTVDLRVGIRRWRDADQTDATLGFRCSTGGAER